MIQKQYSTFKCLITSGYFIGNFSYEIQGVPSELGLGFVDLGFECSFVCPTLLGLMGIWQKRLGSWARLWNTEIKVNPTQVYEHMGRPVVFGAARA